MIIQCKTGEKFDIQNNEDYYNLYLSSVHWKNIKSKIKKQKRCWACGTVFKNGWNRIGHHRTRKSYQRLGNEKLGFPFYDVVACCEACHSYKSRAHKKLHADKYGNIIPKWSKIKEYKMEPKKRLTGFIIFSRTIGILFSPVLLLKHLWYQFTALFVLMACLGIYIYRLYKSKTPLSHEYKVLFEGYMIQAWTIILCGIIVTLALIFLVGFTIATRKNITIN